MNSISASNRGNYYQASEESRAPQTRSPSTTSDSSPIGSVIPLIPTRNLSSNLSVGSMNRDRYRVLAQSGTPRTEIWLPSNEAYAEWLAEKEEATQNGEGGQTGQSPGWPHAKNGEQAVKRDRTYQFAVGASGDTQSPATVEASSTRQEISMHSSNAMEEEKKRMQFSSAVQDGPSQFPTDWGKQRSAPQFAFAEQDGQGGYGWAHNNSRNFQMLRGEYSQKAMYILNFLEPETPLEKARALLAPVSMLSMADDPSYIDMLYKTLASSAARIVMIDKGPSKASQAIANTPITIWLALTDKNKPHLSLASHCGTIMHECTHALQHFEDRYNHKQSQAMEREAIKVQLEVMLLCGAPWNELIHYIKQKGDHCNREIDTLQPTRFARIPQLQT